VRGLVRTLPGGNIELSEGIQTGVVCPRESYKGGVLSARQSRIHGPRKKKKRFGKL